MLELHMKDLFGQFVWSTGFERMEEAQYRRVWRFGMDCLKLCLQTLARDPFVDGKLTNDDHLLAMAVGERKFFDAEPRIFTIQNQ